MATKQRISIRLMEGGGDAKARIQLRMRVVTPA